MEVVPPQTPDVVLPPYAVTQASGSQVVPSCVTATELIAAPPGLNTRACTRKLWPAAATEPLPGFTIPTTGLVEPVDASPAGSAFVPGYTGPSDVPVAKLPLASFAKIA